MSTCISSGAKQILSRLFKRIKADPDLSSKTYVAQLIKDLEALPVCKLGKEPKKRKTSKWQLCLRKELTGKKWDPSRIKELSKLYKEGKCP